MTAFALTGNAFASRPSNLLEQSLNKSNKVRVESATNFDRFNYIDPPLPKLVFAHIALRLAQKLG